MKAYIITVKGNELSEESANKTLQSAKQSGLVPEIYYGVNKYEAEHILTNSGLDIDNKDGVFTYYFANGSIEMKGAFKKDLREGEWFFYNGETANMDKVTYLNGEIYDAKN